MQCINNCLNFHLQLWEYPQVYDIHPQKLWKNKAFSLKYPQYYPFTDYFLFKFFVLVSMNKYKCG
jgi:hypothetical protein